MLLRNMGLDCGGRIPEMGGNVRYRSHHLEMPKSFLARPSTK
ncbi:MAG TPA: hypothetical protein VET69_03775 [Terriglobales bacterium]|nr:hypothetical protein [Terriglobales bacterium]